MKDIDIHFRQTGDNEFWLIYNQESFVIKTYNDGKFHNKRLLTSSGKFICFPFMENPTDSGAYLYPPQ